MLLRIFYIFVSFLFIYSSNSFSITTPSISANTLFLYRSSNLHKNDINPVDLDSSPNGLDIREAELQIYSDVDPYTRLNLLLSVVPKYTTDGTKVTQEWGLEPEEVFAESNVLSDVTFKIGKFKAAMGKHNLLHTHAFPFIEGPLTHTLLLGDEGLTDTGVSAALLLSTSWFSEFTMQALKGKGENEEFNSPSPGKGVGLIHWKNLIDLNDDTTFEGGMSYAEGSNSYLKKTFLKGLDLTVKWRPSSDGKYRSLSWFAEYLARHQEQSSVPEEVGEGIVTWVQYQFAERWAGSYRYDQFKMKNSFNESVIPNEYQRKQTLAFTYSPSEFGSYKAEYGQQKGLVDSSGNTVTEKSFFLQANFTIGAHPAHSY